MNRVTLAVFVQCALLSLCAPIAAQAQIVTVLHSFADGSVANDGKSPQAALVAGSDGNFYGTTAYGGSAGAGVVFQMTPSGDVVLLHQFRSGTPANDGEDPLAPLIEAPDGAFYGTTAGGGTSGTGAVFQIDSSLKYSLLYRFSKDDGTVPYAGLALAKNGVLYGDTTAGGEHNQGAVFSLTTQGVEVVLRSFLGNPALHDGSHPFASLILGPGGYFYGTTSEGGTTRGAGQNQPGEGTIFKISANRAYKILHNFGDGSVPDDGLYPNSSLVYGSDGNFYGTTPDGGSAGAGTVFRMTDSGEVTILHSFGDGSVENDGSGPVGALVEGADGNYYGVTVSGGTHFYGTIFQVTPAGQVAILHSFADGSVANDGEFPFAGPVQAQNGLFYGTTESGGSAGQGTVYEMQTPELQIMPLAQKGGKTFSGKIALLAPVATKTTVTLTSSDPADVTIAKMVVIPAGHSTVTFPIAAKAVALSMDITITAQLPAGDLSGSFTIQAP